MKVFRLFAIFLLCFGCSGPSRESLEVKRWMQENGRIKVLCAIAMIQDVVQQVGGEHVDSITLITGELDPHIYQLVKGDDEKLAFADLIFYNGLGLIHGPNLRQYLSENSKAISLGNEIQKTDPSLILLYNGQMDPHIWMDISLWAKTVPFIVDTLRQYDPDHAEDYKQNGEKLVREMVQKHEHVKQIIRQIPVEKRYLVTSHDAFNYFTRAYLATDNENSQQEWQKRFAAPEGLAPESQLSTTDIQLIINHMSTYNIEVLFPESNVSQDSIQKILDAGQEKGMNLRIAQDALYGDAMGKPGSSGDTYLKMIEHNAKLISNYLTNNE